MVYSTRRFVLCLTLCHFVLLLFSPFSTVITSLGEERANLSAFRMFVLFALVWFCLFPLPLGVWEGLRFVMVALPGLFSSFFITTLNGRAFSCQKCIRNRHILKTEPIKQKIETSTSKQDPEFFVAYVDCNTMQSKH